MEHTLTCEYEQAAMPERAFDALVDSVLEGHGIDPVQLEERRQELRDHLDDAYYEALVGGATPTAARDAAIRRFGDIQRCRRAMRQACRAEDVRNATRVPDALALAMLADLTLMTVWTVHATGGNALSPQRFALLTAVFVTLGAVVYLLCVVGWRLGLYRARRALRERVKVVDLASAGALLVLTPPIWVFFGAGVSSRLLGVPLEHVPQWRAACDAALEVARQIIRLAG